VRIRARGWFALLAVAGMPAGCQIAPPDTSPTAITTPTAPSGPDQEPRSASLPAPIDWTGAGDCLDQLKLLHAMAAQGRLEEVDAPPFAVALVTPVTSLEWVRAPAVPLIADLPLDSYEDQGTAATAASCLLLVEQPGNVRAAHRVVDFQTVASEYQSGVRSEKNPDYDAAQARLREAERGTKTRGPRILGVGDPMLDLVGLLVGGVIATFGQFGSDDDLDEALAALKETPRSRDRPVYRAYEFERSMVRAGKEATVPIALRDLRRGRIWGSQLRQREMRQFSILDGLDPRDRDYEQHRAGALSWQEFEHWQQQPPQLPMSALVAALVERGGAGEGPQTSGSELIAEVPPTAPQVDWLAAVEELEDSTVLPRVTALAPSAGPGIGSARSEDRSPVVRDAPPRTESRALRPTGAAVERTVLAAALDPRVASVVRLEAGSRRGSGFYVRPRLVVTTVDIVGRTSVIDVTTSDGEAVLGLVVHTDPDRGLAVVHVPRAGRPAPLLGAPAWGPAQTVDVLELMGHGEARLTRATLQAGNRTGSGAPELHLELDAADAATSTGAPVFLADRAIALVAAREGGAGREVVPIEALDALLESEPLAALH
jgi:hypothetical protein